MLHPRTHVALHEVTAPLRDVADRVLSPGVRGFRCGATSESAHSGEYRRFRELFDEYVRSAGFVVFADVARFFPTLQNEQIKSALAATMATSELTGLFEFIDRMAELQLPAVPAGYADARLVANLVLHQADNLLDVRFTRWIDDYRLFIPPRRDPVAVIRRLEEGLATILRITLSTNTLDALREALVHLAPSPAWGLTLRILAANARRHDVKQAIQAPIPDVRAALVALQTLEWPIPDELARTEPVLASRLDRETTPPPGHRQPPLTIGSVWRSDAGPGWTSYVDRTAGGELLSPATWTAGNRTPRWGRPSPSSRSYSPVRPASARGRRRCGAAPLAASHRGRSRRRFGASRVARQGAYPLATGPQRASPRAGPG